MPAKKPLQPGEKASLQASIQLPLHRPGWTIPYPPSCHDFPLSRRLPRISRPVSVQMP